MTELELLQANYEQAQELVEIGVWVCRLLSMIVGLLIFRFVTLRSPI